MIYHISSLTTLVQSIKPIDAVEEQDQKTMLAWIGSGKPLYRLKKPDIPPVHLSTYFVLIDQKEEQLLLTYHKKAQAWIPPGGHVEINEDPRDTVIRECQEELQLEANFISDNPFFISPNYVIESGRPHTDINLWYILKGDMHLQHRYDLAEFVTIGWFSKENIPWSNTEKNMARFIDKLQTAQIIK